MAAWCPAYGEGETDPVKAARLVKTGPAAAVEVEDLADLAEALGPAGADAGAEAAP